MNLKKTNTALLTIVCVLLIIVVLVLIKILFSDVKGFEWGSVSDCFSTIANFTMAGTAFYAAIKASKWLTQNMHNDAYILTKKIVIDDYAHILLSMRDSHFAMFRYSHHHYDFYNLKKFHPTELIEETRINFKSSVYRIHDMDKNLILLRKVGFKLSNSIKNNHDDFMNTAYKSIGQHHIFWSMCLNKEKIKKGAFDDTELSQLNQELISSYNEISLSFKKLEDSYEKLVINDLKIMDYVAPVINSNTN